MSGRKEGARLLAELERVQRLYETRAPIIPYIAEPPPAKPPGGVGRAWRAMFQPCKGCGAVRAAVTRVFRR